MDCEKYLELLSARLDGVLTGEEERALEAHLAVCPECRALADHLAQLRDGFSGLEEREAPEGFAQEVMERIRAEEPKKVIPLFKRPQLRALAGLAACLVLAVGLYGASRPRHLDKTEKIDMAVRGFSRGAQVESEEFPQVNASLVDPESADIPRIAAYSASEPPASDMQKAAPEGQSAAEEWEEFDQLLILDRMPEGAKELMEGTTVAVFRDPETGVSTYYGLTPETLAGIEELAYQQGLIPGTSASSPAGERCALRILETGS